MDDENAARGKRARTALLVVLGLQVAVLVAAVAATSMSDPEVEADTLLDDELGWAIPWLPRGGPTQTISGRAVSPDGDPIGGVAVQLVYPGDPHWPETVAYETASDAEGKFAFDGVARRVQFMIVLNGQEARRTFDPPWDLDAAELRVGDIRLAPDQPVRVVVRCTSPPRLPLDRRPDEGEPPRVQLHWLPGDELYAYLILGAEDTPPDERYGESSELPGHHTSVPRVPRSARTFVHETRLPAGRFLATVTGPCGVAQREVEIQPGQAQVIELASPVPDEGSLTIGVAPDGAPSHPPTVGDDDVGVDTFLRLGPVSLTSRTTRPGQSSRVDGLPPGIYRVHVIGHDCPREVEIPPGGAVLLWVGRDGCRVVGESEPTEPTTTPP
jgi:hypothetical protein